MVDFWLNFHTLSGTTRVRAPVMSHWGHWCRAWVSTSSTHASRWVRGSVAREWERVIVELGSDMMDGWVDGWMDGWMDGDRTNYNC